VTKRSTNPVSALRTALREDTTPKPRPAKRGVNKGGNIAAARARGTDTSNLSAAEIAGVIDPDKPLTDKQKLFVKFWAEGESIPSASARAGYNDSAAIAYRMVKYPNVLKLYHEIKAKYEEASQMTRQKVMDGLLEGIEMAKLMAEPSTMISGWREVGKMCGYYAPVEHKMKVDVTGNIVVDRLNSLSDAELLKVITSGAQQLLGTPE
jgi:phage terminase small subunit